MRTRSSVMLAAAVLMATVVGGCSFGGSGSQSDALTIEINGSAVDGELSAETPENMFQFLATAGTNYYVETSQLVPAVAGDECDTQIALLRRPDEAPIVADDDGGLEYLASAIYWTAPVSGVYYVSVVSYQDDTGDWTGLGTYQIAVKTAPPAIPAQTALVVDGGGQPASLDLGEKDWYSFTGQAGQTYLIFTSELSPECDTMLYLRDRALLDLAFNDDVSEDNLASAISFTAEYTGTYYIMAQTWGEHIGTYRIEVITE